jgi:DNA-binding transcriptional LysR family regulator
MNFRQLSSFLAVVEEGSFTRAARRLQIAQPSLSQQIRSLEAELGGELIERLPRGVRLTAAGRAFLPEAQAAVRATARAESAARMALGLEAGELEVATLLSMAVGILPGAITQWHERFQEIGIRVHEYTHPNLLEQDVRAGVGDIALGPTPLAWEGPVRKLGWEEMLLVLPGGDPLAGRRRVPLAELRGRRWILFREGHGLMEAVTSACEQAGFQPRPAIRTMQVAAALRLATEGLGVAMVPDNSVPPGFAGSVARPDPPVIRELAAYCRGEWSPLSRSFLEALRSLKWRRRPEGAAIVVERGRAYIASGRR